MTAPAPGDTPLYTATSDHLLFTPDLPRHALIDPPTRTMTTVTARAAERAFATAPADILAAGGIANPSAVAAIAAATGLELAAAVTLLLMESGGGRNVWGHDRVPNTYGEQVLYHYGAEVTQRDYSAYRAHRAVIGCQGVGPTQLTWSGYQDQADALGGCWDWATNVRVGFTILGGHLHRLGETAGFAAYNGSGPAAQAYARKALGILTDWRRRLGAPSGPDSLPALNYGDKGPAVSSLQRFCNAFPWHPVLPLLPVTGFYGPQTVAVVAAAQLQCGIKGGDGRNVGPQTREAFWARGWRG